MPLSGTPVDQELTVAQIRGPETDDHVEVLFLESARIYVLERAQSDFAELLGRLEKGTRVRIATTAPDGDVIEDIEAVAT